MTLTVVQAREALAEALSAIDGLNVRSRGPVKSPRTGDGWVTIGRVTPADYSRSHLVLTAIVTLGNDEATAEDLLSTLIVDAVDAATQIDEMPTADVAAEPVAIAVDGGPPLHGFTITATTEVER